MLDFDNKNKIYLCHFPGDTAILQEQVEKELINKKFSVDKQISLVCAFNININDGGLLPFNKHISTFIDILYDDDLFDKEWDMSNKIHSILNSLKRCRTKYALVSDVRDVVITADIDKSFIDKFESMKCDIVYNATTSKFPKISLQSDNLIEGGSGVFKYLNAGICFGYTDKLIEWYEHCDVRFENNKSEQFVIRKMYEPKFNIKIDGERKLFRSCHSYDTIFFKDKKELYLAHTNNPYIEVDKKFRYKYLLPNGKLIKGKLKEIESFDERTNICTLSLYDINSERIDFMDYIKYNPNNFKKTTLKLLLNDKNKRPNEKAIQQILKEINRLELSIYDEDNKENLKWFLDRINNYEYNHISKIIVNVFEKFIKEDIFPNDERLIVKWYPKEPEIKKVKIIDKKHTGYYFIKLKSDEILQFITNY